MPTGSLFLNLALSAAYTPLSVGPAAASTRKTTGIFSRWETREWETRE